MRTVILFCVIVLTACGKPQKLPAETSPISPVEISFPEGHATRIPKDEQITPVQEDTEEEIPAAACKPQPIQPPPVPPAYAADALLKINEIQMKGSHNSYHLSSDAPNAPAWTQFTLPPLTEQLEKYGVRQFELDVHYTGERFLVFHVPGYDKLSNCPEFQDCLCVLLNWSYAHPFHQPLFVWIELKDRWDLIKIAPNIEALESAVRMFIPREKLLTPDDVRRGRPNPVAALQEFGWPSLDTARGKFVFVMMDEGNGRYAYTYGGTTLAGRSMFVTQQNDSLGIIAMIDDVLNNEATVDQAVRDGLLVRSRVDDFPGMGGSYAAQRDAALRLGAHMITTDYPIDDTIAGYSVNIPGGTPSRCNPVTAQAFCTSLMIEDPAYLAVPK